ncbi:MAG: NAD(P)/FAD-dependent oxidoreductase [Halobacteria archaeon]|nr:NAD(P)/FAD-dependent oxidoreductase [Halobacteria archaeon]
MANFDSAPTSGFKPDSNSLDVAIVGAGVAGLVAARHLGEAGAQVSVFERESHVGGRVSSVRRDGFTFDRGFQVLFTAYPYARKELNYEKLDLRFFNPGAQIAREGRVTALSDPLRDFSSLLPTLLNTDVTLRDKIRVLNLKRELVGTEPRRIFQGDDKTIREYLEERGFSGRFIRNFAEPFYGGITLDRSLSTSKKVFEFTFRMMSQGSIAVPSQGMGSISEQLASKARGAGAGIELNSEVESISTDGESVTLDLDNESVTADAVVVATDPKQASELTGIESIPTDANGCVTQYYEIPVDLGMGRMIILNATSKSPNHVVPLSNVAPEYAPDDTKLVSAVFLGESAFEESDEDLADRTRGSLSKWYGTDIPDLNLLHTDRIEFAQFSQPPGIFSDLPGNRTRQARVYLAGEYTEASSINAAMASGRKASRAVIDDLSTSGDDVY